tara:strand:+ start:425 stop:640 length:216 start_codon:yes stop_codon:yes gene_type:complete
LGKQQNIKIMVFKMKGFSGFKQKEDKKAIMDRMKALELIIKKNKELNMPYDQELKELSELEDKLMNVKKPK